MRHKLYLDDYTQAGKNRITLPPALADYYGNTATAYVNGRQVLSKTELDGTDYNLTFNTPTPTKEIEIGRGNLELASVEPDTENRNVLSFDGVNDWVYCGTADDGLQNYEITLDFWVKATYSHLKLLFADQKANIAFGFYTHSGGEQLAIVSTVPETLPCPIIDDWDDTIWNHVIIITNQARTTVTCYVNGVQKTNKPSYSNQWSDVSGRRFGQKDNRYYFHGELADLKLWKNGSELAAWYKFNEGTGTTLNDSAGSNDGTITGATWTTDDVPVPIKTPEVLHWTPSSDIGWYWVLTEDEAGNKVYVKVAGEWKEGTLYLKVDGSWVQASDVNVKSGGTWK